MKRLILLIFLAATIVFTSVFFISRSITNAESAAVQHMVATVTIGAETISAETVGDLTIGELLSHR